MTPLDARLASSDRDERYAACKELRAAASITSGEARALLRALGDRDFGQEMESDHAGGGQYNAYAIADVARQALEAHAVVHHGLLVNAWKTASAHHDVLAALVVAGATLERVLALRDVPEREMRLAVLARLRRELETTRAGRKVNGVAQIDAAELERVAPFARALQASVDDPDREVAHRARQYTTGTSHGFEREVLPIILAHVRG